MLAAVTWLAGCPLHAGIVSKRGWDPLQAAQLVRIAVEVSRL